MQLFSIYDRKAKIYLQPFTMKNETEALRSFMRLVTDDKSQIKQFPEDYELTFIGDWDEKSGDVIVSQPKPVLLMTASNAVALMSKGPANA